jgi:hypothetical protein
VLHNSTIHLCDVKIYISELLIQIALCIINYALSKVFLLKAYATTFAFHLWYFRSQSNSFKYHIHLLCLIFSSCRSNKYFRVLWAQVRWNRAPYKWCLQWKVHGYQRKVLRSIIFLMRLEMSRGIDYNIISFL